MGQEAIYEHEQLYFDQLQARIKEISAQTNQELANFSGTPSRHLGIRVEQEAMQDNLMAKSEKLSRANENLCFGKITLSNKDSWYIGKIGLSDTNQDKLLLDWRSPMAGLFYKASAVEDNGVARKRLFRSKENKIISISDEEYIKGICKDLVLSQDSALKEALNRKRTGKMQEIIATIEVEQDRIMRLPNDGMLVIQGAPGTGKTVVGLHRAAYLLYNDRLNLADRGVLVVGPNTKFLNYIEEVLPMLGEYEVELGLVSSLVNAFDVKYKDDLQGDQAKNNIDFILGLKSVVSSLRNIPTKNITFNLTGEKILLTVDDIRKAVSHALTQEETYNNQRITFLNRILKILTDKIVILREIDTNDFEAEEYDEITQELREDLIVRKTINQIWLPYSAEQVLYKISKDSKLLNKSGLASHYSELSKYKERYLNQVYSLNDILILDELVGYLGEYKPKYIDDHISYNPKSNYLVEPKTYGHVIVDEAQELSYLAWRALRRRIPSGSATILGDMYQRESDVMDLSWEEIKEAFSARKMRVEELKINYRTPKSIFDISLALLKEERNQLREVSSIREVENSYNLITGDYKYQDIAVKFTELSKEGLGVIIVPEILLADLSQSPIAPWVCTADQSKGVEYDFVMILEPTLILEEGFSRLYVALTRATTYLEVYTKELETISLSPSLTK